MREVVRTWFSLTRPVGPRFYAASGIGLALVKYTMDAMLVWLATGRLWTPLAYLNPSLAAREAATGAPPQWAFWVLVLWSLPFYWIGISMTVRRTVEAGLAAAWSMLFFVPIVNYLYMILLCFLPASEATTPPSASRRDGLGGVFYSTAIGVLVGLAMMGLSVVWLRGYGAALFLGTPFVMGFVAALRFNRDAPRSALATLGVAYLTLVVVAGLIALLALEGLVCLLMEMPLALLLSSLGAVLGRQIALGGRPAAAVASLLVALPVLTGFEARGMRAPLREVSTAVDIDAPPESVWRNVIGIAELPPPGELVFRLGIAYPVRARIHGAGVGAVRTCEFSTGPFIEPITQWDPPRRLGFDVRSQPPTMEEWSPYRHVDAPHLVDGLRSERGEFRLFRSERIERGSKAAPGTETIYFPNSTGTFGPTRSFTGSIAACSST